MGSRSASPGPIHGDAWSRPVEGVDFAHMEVGNERRPVVCRSGGLPRPKTRSERFSRHDLKPRAADAPQRREARGGRTVAQVCRVSARCPKGTTKRGATPRAHRHPALVSQSSLWPFGGRVPANTRKPAALIGFRPLKALVNLLITRMKWTRSGVARNFACTGVTGAC